MAGGDVADLVEEERAAVGQLEPPLLAAVGPGERALARGRTARFRAATSCSTAQFRATNGPLRRLSAAWIAWATSSLPVPVSPWIRTVEPSGPTCSIRSKILRIFGLFDTMLWKL